MLSILLPLLLASTPITRVGSNCPFGYFSQGSYCVQSAALRDSTRSIPRSSSTCPFGTYKAGNYCTWSNR